jgi:glycerate-2-kinase
MTTHTPGPWYVGTDFSDQARHIYAVKMVCDDDGEEWHPLIASTDDDERLIDWQANARLIAAAPDLLEALEAYVSADDEIYGDSIGGEVREKARAAIDKATQEPTA